MTAGIATRRSASIYRARSGATRVGVVLLLTLLVLLTGATSASAESMHQPDASARSAAPVVSVASGLVRAEGSAGGDGVTPEEQLQNLYDSSFRTVNRWSDTASRFFYKFDSLFGPDLLNLAQRGMAERMYLSAGNTMQGVTSDMVRSAVTFEPLNSVGSMIDKVTAQVAKIFTSSGGVGSMLLVAIIVGVLLGTMWRTMRSGGSLMLVLRRMGGIVVIVGLVFSMAFSAVNAQDDPKDKAGTYNPAVMTPGWIVKKINDSVSFLAQVPAQGFVDGISPLIKPDGTGGAQPAMQVNGESFPEYFTDGVLDCGVYVENMERRLSDNQDLVANSSAVAITAVMDSLWDTSGLHLWKSVQTGGGNPYGDASYCHILDLMNDNTLEKNNGVTLTLDDYNGGSLFWKLNYPKGEDGPVLSELAPFTATTNYNKAASATAWAACKATDISKNGNIAWEWRDGWAGFLGGASDKGGHIQMVDKKDAELVDGADASVTAEKACSTWWTSKADTRYNDNAGAAVFDVNGDLAKVINNARHADSPGLIVNFLTSLHGTADAGGFAAPVYAGSSVLQFLAFGFLSLITYIARLLLVVFAIAMILVLVGALFTPRPGESLGKSFSKFLGLTIIGSILTLVMTFVVLFTRIVITLGESMFGVVGIGSSISMVWAGLAPLIALVLVHLLFTKIFHMPSPVSIKGAQAWGTAGISGALGAAAGAGVGAAVGSRLGSAAKRQIGNASRKVGGAALDKMGLKTGQGKRRSEMGAGPKQRDAPAVATAEGGEESTNSALAGLTPAQLRKHEQKKAAWDKKEELRVAREWNKQVNGVDVAPGDLKGAMVAGVVHTAAGAQKKLAATKVGKELHARKEHRQALRAATTSGDTETLTEARKEQQRHLGKVTRGITAVMDSPAALGNRVNLGVERGLDKAADKAKSLWNSPKIAGARLDAAYVGGKMIDASHYVAQSDVGRVATTVGRVTGRPVAAAARGMGAVASRSRNNEAVVAEYRQAIAAQQAQQKTAEEAQSAQANAPMTGSGRDE